MFCKCFILHVTTVLLMSYKRSFCTGKSYGVSVIVITTPTFLFNLRNFGAEFYHKRVHLGGVC